MTCLTTTSPGLGLLQQLIFAHFTVNAAVSSGVYNNALGLLPGALPVGTIDLNLTTWLVSHFLSVLFCLSFPFPSLREMLKVE